jgi:hypothetical protein
MVKAEANTIGVQSARIKANGTSERILAIVAMRLIEELELNGDVLLVHIVDLANKRNVGGSIRRAGTQSRRDNALKACP